jgi:signal transduction histidine kinase
MSLQEFEHLLFSPGSDEDQHSLMEMIFDRMPMGMAVLDRDFNIQRYNPTWIEYSKKYAPPDSKPLAPGVNYYDHLPDAKPATLALFQRALAGETVRVESVYLKTGDLDTYWDAILSPLIKDDEVVGILNVSIDVTERVRLQQELEQRVEERTQEIEQRRQVAESMRDIIRMINSSLPLEEFLQQAVQMAARQLGAAACALHQFDLENNRLINLGSVGMEGILDNRAVRPISELKMTGGDAYFNATMQRQPTYGNYPEPDHGIEQIRNDPTINDELKPRRIELRRRFAGALSVPLFIQDRVFGGMVFYYAEPQEFDDDQVQLGMTFGDQVAIAIENTRLMQTAERAAATMERNRLARDLHDAVTQTLFSASMIADVLPKIWRRNPEEGLKRLEELRQLTRGALSEMRTLLVELRPAAMEDTDLGDLIGHLVNAFIARTRVPVTYERGSGRAYPPAAVKEMFYRITQEAFNNINKHAHASQVNVELACQPGAVRLLIRDDGAGFNMENAHEGFGLKIMRERAQNAGAQFAVNSQPGQGTAITVTWLAPEQKEKADE